MYNGFGAGAISRHSALYAWITESAENEMIDEQATFEKYGYYSTEWKPQSHKKIVVVCDVCGAIRYINKGDYRDLCPSCAQKRKKMPPFTNEHCHNMSKSAKERKIVPHTDEGRQHISAGLQGIPYEDWTGFVSDDAYCEKFDDACRERIRVKYNHRCFICDTPQDENITKKSKIRKLNVHHVDMNKDQGCNGNEWKLVPLCLHCHPKAHHQPMKSRLVYLIGNE